MVEALFRSVKHVCETNLLRRTELRAMLTLPTLASELAEEPDTTVYSAVKLTGDRPCTIGLVMPESLALVVAKDFLNYDPSQLEFGAGLPVYRDATGEVNNMLAGSFKSALSRSGIACRLSPPVIVNGPTSLLRVLGTAQELMIARFTLEEFSIRVCLWT